MERGLKDNKRAVTFNFYEYEDYLSIAKYILTMTENRYSDIELINKVKNIIPCRYDDIIHLYRDNVNSFAYDIMIKADNIAISDYRNNTDEYRLFYNIMDNLIDLIKDGAKVDEAYRRVNLFENLYTEYRDDKIRPNDVVNISGIIWDISSDKWKKFINEYKDIADKYLQMFQRCEETINIDLDKWKKDIIPYFSNINKIFNLPNNITITIPSEDILNEYYRDKENINVEKEKYPMLYLMRCIDKLEDKYNSGQIVYFIINEKNIIENISGVE